MSATPLTKPVLSKKAQFRELFNVATLRLLMDRAIKMLALPGFGILVFLFLWQLLANNIITSLGQFPGPNQVWEQSKSLVTEHRRERSKETAFYQRQEVRNAKKLADDPSATVKIRSYTGKATFLDQIFTSLLTVAFGFMVATLVAVPLGILCGLSESLYRCINPIIQTFKPVSPLAWLPLVTMVVSALYVSDDPLFDKAFLTSAFTVALCCLWPTVVNTIVGVASIDRDLINVSRVLRLGSLVHIRKVVIPSAIPLIFTGLRLSLATGWMVLIAAEMLAQNPGLGKFIWDEFQNGSSNSLGRIMVAVLVIGIIGFILDSLMLALQKHLSWDKQATLR
ncbi:ABC-type nitrate/sulfonate/bicarbonate transport system, permease component [marine gamma proteobacterium HTCC2143]|jgi:nitrate/nitrite transport system permease protein|uniref:ABC-type nitrate/sulfonate/bicarbonate transport system, permease component n=1 Tax=marine gamma proteobacterium HTCC2143 TaxID=247633 RepID=A0YDN1_9GAMM|nr:ABC-type nitrate/sulfonate/bicarbonate transport system, permease component [marine gamma proteobacterium HTCC2143]